MSCPPDIEVSQLHEPLEVRGERGGAARAEPVSAAAARAQPPATRRSVSPRACAGQNLAHTVLLLPERHWQSYTGAVMGGCYPPATVGDTCR